MTSKGDFDFRSGNGSTIYRNSLYTNTWIFTPKIKFTIWGHDYFGISNNGKTQQKGLVLKMP